MTPRQCFDLGYEQHAATPDMLLAEVWRFAASSFADNVENVRAFVDGYTAARRQRDEKEQEARK